MINFTSYLQQQNFSIATQNRYTKDVNYFLSWVDIEIENCTKKQILDYLTYLQDVKHNTNHSRNCALNSLKHYFNHLVQNNQLNTNPTNQIKIRGTKKKQLYKTFTAEELTQLNDNFYTYYVKENNCKAFFEATLQRAKLSTARNYNILGFFLYQGLTTNEVQNLTINDIDLIKATVFVKGTNRSNERIITLQPTQIGSLIQYLNVTRNEFSPQNNNLFLTLPEYENSNNKNQTCKNAIITLNQLIKTIEPNFINFKQIRASVITNWLQLYGLRKTQYLAGHRFISSTENYLNNELQSLTNDINQFNPF